MVHQFAPGHRLAIVLAGGDLAYPRVRPPQEVTLTTGPSLRQRRDAARSPADGALGPQRVRRPTWPRTQSTISVMVAPGVKTSATPSLLSSGMSSSGMMPPPKTTMSSAPRSRSSSQPREQRHVRAGQDRQADRVGVLLDGGLDDLLGRLVQAGVDDLDAGVAQRAGDHLRAAVVPVEARLGDDHPDAFVRHGGQLRSDRHERSDDGPADRQASR